MFNLKLESSKSPNVYRIHDLKSEGLDLKEEGQDVKLDFMELNVENQGPKDHDPLGIRRSGPKSRVWTQNPNKLKDPQLKSEGMEL